MNPPADLPPSYDDRTVPYVTLAIAGCAVVVALFSLAFVPPKFAAGVICGGAIALANFAVHARVIRATTSVTGGGSFWSGVYLLKLTFLFVSGLCSVGFVLGWLIL